jgi:hypothetical protein
MTEKDLIQITAELRAKGYDDDFYCQKKNILRNTEGLEFAPEQLKIKEVYRLEGSSDPDGMCVVFALEDIVDPTIRGIFIGPYGPMMTINDASIASRLQDDRPQH